MIHVAILCLLVGQVPPPPVPRSPESHKESPSADDAKGQRQWLLDHLTADLLAQGKLDAQKRQEVERMVNAATDRQVGEAVQYYQQQLAEAQANLRRQQAYRDNLKRELQWKTAIRRQEQAQGDMRYSPQAASIPPTVQPPWIQSYGYPPYVCSPYPHHYHRRW